MVIRLVELAKTGGEQLRSLERAGTVLFIISLDTTTRMAALLSDIDHCTDNKLTSEDGYCKCQKVLVAGNKLLF